MKLQAERRQRRLDKQITVVALVVCDTKHGTAQSVLRVSLGVGQAFVNGPIRAETLLRRWT